MAGINRLGKAPPRPGSLRPADPNRNRTIDFFSEDQTGALESDRDYQRTVQDIEDAQQTQGWLFGRGAFDKTDLLYLRDQEEKSRHMEQELHDKEVTQYARLRLQAEKGRFKESVLSATKAIDKERPRPVAKKIASLVKRKGGPAAVVEAATAAQKPSPAQASPTATAPPKHDEAKAAGDAEPAGLPGLLGEYGSDSDDRNSDADEPNDSRAGQPTAAATAAAQSQKIEASAADRAQAHSRAKAAGAGFERGQGEETDYGT